MGDMPEGVNIMQKDIQETRASIASRASFYKNLIRMAYILFSLVLIGIGILFVRWESIFPPQLHTMLINTLLLVCFMSIAVTFILFYVVIQLRMKK